jgi:antitoxin component YwqK of YwqJK toxin-antitoxin module
MKVRILIFITILIAGCSVGGGDSSATEQPAAASAGLEVVEQVDDYGYTERFQRRIADGVREGRYQRIGPVGIVEEEAFYVADTLHGARILFYSSGDTLSIEHYQRGDFEGPYRQYYENGQLQLAGQYEANKATGKWYQYYDSGELMEIVTFEDNVENGPFVEYFRNGNLKAEGSYLDGDNEHGLLKLYDETGMLIRKMECEQGVCRTIWRAEDPES